MLDRSLAIQLRTATSSVPLNVAEGSALRGGRRNTYEIALGEAQETRTILEAAEGASYIRSIEPHVMVRLPEIIGSSAR